MSCCLRICRTKACPRGGSRNVQREKSRKSLRKQGGSLSESDEIVGVGFAAVYPLCTYLRTSLVGTTSELHRMCHKRCFQDRRRPDKHQRSYRGPTADFDSKGRSSISLPVPSPPSPLPPNDHFPPAHANISHPFRAPLQERLISGAFPGREDPTQHRQMQRKHGSVRLLLKQYDLIRCRCIWWN